MKTKILIIAIHILLSVAFLQAQVVRTINVTTAGTLNTLLGTEKTTITDLTLTGTINAADFTTIKQMTALKDLDMGAVNIDNGTIPSQAFMNKTMNTIILPSSMKAIGSQVFSGAKFFSLDFTHCINLEEIGYIAFGNIKLENNILDFSKCSKLTRFLTFQHYNGTFYDNSSHVILPENMTNLPYLTFKNFKGSVVLPKGLQVISSSVFENVVLDEGIILPKTLHTIASGAFYKTTLPFLNFSACSELEEIGNNAFEQAVIGDRKIDLSRCSKLTRFGNNAGWNRAAFTGCVADIVLPDSLTIIPSLVFSGFKGTVVLHEGITTIGGSAFYNAVLEDGINLPSTLKTIASGAFQGTTLPFLNFSACLDLEEIGYSAFDAVKIADNRIDLSSCTNLIRFPSGSYNRGTFTGCAADIALPQNLTVVPALSFSGFSGSVVLHEGIATIGSSAFYNAVLENGINLPSTLKTIASGAFPGTTLPFLDFTPCLDLEEIGYSAFDAVKIADNRIDLSSCINLIRFPSGSYNRGTFTGCAADIALPQNLTVVPALSFSGFKGSVEFSSILETIFTNAFLNASLTKGLVFPASLKTIGDRAFYNAVIPSIEFEGMDMNLSCP